MVHDGFDPEEFDDGFVESDVEKLKYTNNLVDFIHSLDSILQSRRLAFVGISAARLNLLQHAAKLERIEGIHEVTTVVYEHDGEEYEIDEWTLEAIDLGSIYYEIDEMRTAWNEVNSHHANLVFAQIFNLFESFLGDITSQMAFHNLNLVPKGQVSLSQLLTLAKNVEDIAAIRNELIGIARTHAKVRDMINILKKEGVIKLSVTEDAFMHRASKIRNKITHSRSVVSESLLKEISPPDISRAKDDKSLLDEEKKYDALCRPTQLGVYTVSDSEINALARIVIKLAIEVNTYIKNTPDLAGLIEKSDIDRHIRDVDRKLKPAQELLTIIEDQVGIFSADNSTAALSINPV